MSGKKEMDSQKFNKLCFKTTAWGIIMGSALTLGGVSIHNDYKYGARRINDVWCYLNNAVRSPETKREVNVRIAGAGLSLEERILFEDCFKRAADSFEKEFGIVLRYSYADMPRLPDGCSGGDIMRMADDANHASHDFTLVATSRMYLTQNDPRQKDYGKLFVYDGRPLEAVDQRYKENGKLFADNFANKTRRLVFINGISNADKLANNIKHEIAHLFYAGHVDGKRNVMYKYVLPGQDIWSDKTREAIKEHKWRIW